MERIRSNSSRNTRRARSDAGFSLLEMVVAVAIFTIVTGAIYALLKVGSSDRFSANQRSELMQNGRFAFAIMGRDSLNAGFNYPSAGASVGDNCMAFMGVPDDASNTEPDLLYPVTAANNANSVDLDGAGPLPANLTDSVTFAMVDDTFNLDTNFFNTRSLAVSTVVGGGNNLQLATTEVTTNCRAGDVYIATDSNSSTIGICTGVDSTNRTLQFAINDATNDPLSINKPGASNRVFNTIGPPASLRRVTWVRYFVNPDGVLVREEVGSPALIEGTGTNNAGRSSGRLSMPLAEGVENMQIQYVISTGTTTVTTDTLTAAQQPQVRQIRVTLTVQGSQVDPQTRRPYRSVMTNVFNTRNLGYIL